MTAPNVDCEQHHASLAVRDIPTAVAMLMSSMFGDAISRDVMPTAFPQPQEEAPAKYKSLVDEYYRNLSKKGGGNRLGEKLFDEQVNVWADPWNPDVPASAPARLAFLRERAVRADTSYVNRPGRTVAQVRDEAMLRDALPR